MESEKQHVSILTVPYSALSPLSGIYEALNAFEACHAADPYAPASPPFNVELVGLDDALVPTATGVSIAPHRVLADVERTDIVIIPSFLVRPGNPALNGSSALRNWLRHMHGQGAMICSACTGVLLLAETGLLNGLDATIHWTNEREFRNRFPKVKLRLTEALVVAGARQEFVMSGASGSWHDLVLYLIARRVGPKAAQAIAKYLALQWHADGQAPYVVFSAPINHGDGVVLRAQRWIETNYQVRSPVEEILSTSGISERSFKRRFKGATGYSPIKYIQLFRIEEAKRRLESTDASVEEISWAVGYEEPAFFRRLFKRVTHLTPTEYRRKFKIPEYLEVTEALRADKRN